VSQSYDFYSPFMSAAIVMKDGTRVPLFTNVEHGNANEYGARARSKDIANLASLPFVESLTVKNNLGFVPTITAVLSPPINDALAFMMSPLMEFGQSILEVQLGYSAGSSTGEVKTQPFSGILWQPEVQIGRDFSITLHAIGTPGWSMTSQEGARVFKARSRASIIEACARGEGLANGRDIEVDFDSVRDESPSANALDAIVNVNQSGLTDWMMIWRMVNECGCWMILNGNTLVIMERDLMLSKAPKYNLRFFGYPGGKLGPVIDPTVGDERGCFPILSASSPTKAVFLPGSTVALVTGGVDSKTGEFNGVTLNKDDGIQRLGGGASDIASSPTHPGINETTGDGAHRKISDINDPKLQAAVKSELAAEQFHLGVRLDVETLGMPDILPGDVVSIKGLTRRYDANYGVFEVVHHVGSHGFTTRLWLQSNTMAVLQNAEKARGPINTQDATTNQLTVAAAKLEQLSEFKLSSSSQAALDRLQVSQALKFISK